MSDLHRRDFLALAAGAAAGLAVGRPAPGAVPRGPEATDDVPPPPQVSLGKTGIALSRVGQGTGMSGGGRQSNHTRLGFEKLVALLRHSYERGVTFFDMADLYGSHVYFREALRSIPREKVAILTKLWWRDEGDPKSVPIEYQKRSARAAIERFRQEIATDHLDIVLLHCLTDPKWDEQMAGYMESLQEAKEKKRIRAVGVSCHNLDAMKRAGDVPWVDVVLARINPGGAAMDGKVEDVVEALRALRAKGKAIIGMKIYGEGRLADRKDECIRFAQQQGLIDCMTVGAEKPEQMDETLRLVAKYPAAKAF